MSELLEQIRQLSVAQRLRLMQEIAADLEIEETDPVLPWQERAVLEAMDEWRRDGDWGEDWPTVRARIVAQTESPPAPTAANGGQ